ncbi:hypothetical protein N7539_007262 [Penicillium diatomitis]|uniref:Haloacid dehalogenase, type II n=1 Tax=Penicillium diatomitis TaxID=2819901 RepID=A0A9W9WUU1_9EURO|nr:uncharacterized protein N7539_007262 [Penicillium diatomitis]KAJ5477118.1 hypothetical protein N7539_007262 [Penicillium diatomitis]
MPSDKETVVAFDVYGTLLSTESIAGKLASHFGRTKAQEIAASWRKYQLEYTWRLNSMEYYEDFSQITRQSLHHALVEAQEQLTEGDISDLMKAYDNLSAFPDVKSTLQRIAADSSIVPVIFSNGSKEMISNSVSSSKDLSPHGTTFKHIVTVDDVQRFKPAQVTYQHLAAVVGKKPSEMDQIWLISGNPFDIVGARHAGLNAVWVDRAGYGWQDAAVPGLQPSAIVRNLEQIIDHIKSS